PGVTYSDRTNEHDFRDARQRERRKRLRRIDGMIEELHAVRRRCPEVSVVFQRDIEDRRAILPAEHRRVIALPEGRGRNDEREKEDRHAPAHGGDFSVRTSPAPSSHTTDAAPSPSTSYQSTRIHPNPQS